MKLPLLVLAAALTAAPALAAPPPAAVRTILQKGDLASPNPMEADLGTAVMPVGGGVARHIHHGVEAGYVAEGEIEISIDGQPVRRLKAGETFYAPREVPHSVRNVGATPVKVVSTWIIDKDRPFSEPTP